jgi:ubiquinone biosynthesis protein UbiJ
VTLVNMKQRYVASTFCSLGNLSQAECAKLANRIFDCDADAAAALVEHLGSAECHTREELARIVGAARAYTHSYRLVYESPVANGYAA